MARLNTGILDHGFLIRGDTVSIVSASTPQIREMQSLVSLVSQHFLTAVAPDHLKTSSLTYITEG